MSEDIKKILDKKSKEISNQKIFKLYHGTNRKFTEHSMDKNRTVLNDKYQGDWICYSDDANVAWDYSEAARNQCFDKIIFLEELHDLFSKEGEIGLEAYELMTQLMEKGYDCWDDVFVKYGEKHNLTEDESRRTYFDNIRILESKLDFNIDDFIDVLEEVEYSVLGQEDSLEATMNFFNSHISQISESSVKFLQKIGFDKSLPETRLLTSEITANKVLKTNNREKAKNARDKGYDLVIYNGEGTVKGKPEYLIADPKQVTIQNICVKNKKTIYLTDDYSEYTHDITYKNIDLTKSNKKQNNLSAKK